MKDNQLSQAVGLLNNHIRLTWQESQSLEEVNPVPCSHLDHHNFVWDCDHYGQLGSCILPEMKKINCYCTCWIGVLISYSWFSQWQPQMTSDLQQWQQQLRTYAISTGYHHCSQLQLSMWTEISCQNDCVAWHLSVTYQKTCHQFGRAPYSHHTLSNTKWQPCRILITSES